MKKWFVGVLFFATIGAVAYRKPILAEVIKQYFLYHNVDIEFTLSKFSFEEFELQNIFVDKKNKISRMHIQFSWKKKYFLENIDIQIGVLNLESLTEIGQKFETKESNSTNTFSLEKIKTDCQNLTQTSLKVKLEEVIMGDTQLKINLHAETANDQLSIAWQDLPKTRGSLLVQCSGNQLTVEAPHLEVELKNTNAFNLTIQDFSINLSQSYLKWISNSPVDFYFPGKISTNIILDKKHYKVSIPSFHLNGKSASFDLKEIKTLFLAKKVEIKTDAVFKADSIEVSAKNQMGESFVSEGTLKVENFQLGKTFEKTIINGLNIDSDFILMPLTYNLNTKIRDKTKQIFIDDLKISGDPEKKTFSINLDRTKTQFRFNSKVLELFPVLEDYLKTLSGKINMGGNIRWNSDSISGFIDLDARKLSSATEFGDFEEMDIQHRIQSFQDFSSPEQQRLRIKKIKIGPGIDNLDVSYKVKNRNSILVHKLSANFEKGLIYADSFSIDIKQKRIENFLAQIVDFDLEKVLSIGLKDSVRASGHLHGHVGVSYKGPKPILRGLLVSPQNGWIQYRPGDRKQATSLSLSDGPMDILNNYLYDFKYEQLSLRIDTDEKFDMKMTLNTFGYNPSYLNGKPLKLNINLEQNLLAAMQSLMLTYDLPARIKEKFEKVEP